jgi:hypothetical protein
MYVRTSIRGIDSSSARPTIDRRTELDSAIQAAAHAVIGSVMKAVIQKEARNLLELHEAGDRGNIIRILVTVLT